MWWSFFCGYRFPLERALTLKPSAYIWILKPLFIYNCFFLSQYSGEHSMVRKMTVVFHPFLWVEEMMAEMWLSWYNQWLASEAAGPTISIYWTTELILTNFQKYCTHQHNLSPFHKTSSSYKEIMAPVSSSNVVVEFSSLLQHAKNEQSHLLCQSIA